MTLSFRVHPLRQSGPALIIVAALLLPACSMGSDRDRSLMRCERTVAQNAPDAAAAEKACACIVDGLEAEGMTILSAATSDRSKQIVRQCGRDAGLPVPAQG